MILGLFIRYVAHRARGPIHDGDVSRRRGLRLVLNGERLSVRRPLRAGFGDFRRVGQVHYLAAVAGNREEVVNFSAAVIGLEDEPFAVRRPGRAGLAIVGLAQLDGPSACGAHFPDVVAPGEVGGEDDFLPVWRPGAVADRSGVEKIVHRNRRRSQRWQRRNRLGVGNLARVWRIRSKHNDRAHQNECQAAEFHKRLLSKRIAP